MKTGQFQITPAGAAVLAALLTFPVHSLAQFTASTVDGRATRPVCVYKGVMSDAEIEACTGFRIRYNYDINSGRSAVREERVTGVTVLRRTPAQAPRRKPRP